MVDIVWVFVTMVAVLTVSGLLRWPLPITLILSAVAGALIAGFGVPFRHLVEGGFGYLNLILALFAGAFFETAHGTRGVETGALLAAAAVAYVAGNLTSRRLTRRDPARVLVLLASASAIADAAFLAAGCGILGSVTLFSAAAFVVGGRTLISSAYAVSLPVERRGAATSLRAATMQFGYFLGSSLGGVALAAGGYRALGAVMGGMFLAGALLLARVAGARSALTTAHRLPPYNSEICNV